MTPALGVTPVCQMLLICQEIFFCSHDYYQKFDQFQFMNTQTTRFKSSFIRRDWYIFKEKNQHDFID